MRQGLIMSYSRMNETASTVPKEDKPMYQSDMI